MTELLGYRTELLFAAILPVAFVKLCLRALRIGHLHRKIKSCLWLWSQAPRISWRTMVDNRIHFCELLAQLGRGHSRGPLACMMTLALSLCAVGARSGAEGLSTPKNDENVEPRAALAPIVPPERLGPVWPVIEPDMRGVIQERLTARLPEIRARLKDSLKTYRIPTTEKPTTETARTLYIDPSITLTADLTSHDGRVLAPAGHRVNPLTILPLRRTYLVIDGMDARQIDWVKQQITAHPKALVTVLLTDGSLEMIRDALPTSAQLFPAPPALFARLPIDSVPAKISRQGDRLQIDLIAEAEFTQ